jgi:general secretion pathway protein G
MMGSSPARTRPSGTAWVRAFTLIELMLAIAVLGILMMLASTGYSRYQERVQVAQAATDIMAMDVQIRHFFMQEGRFPTDLAEIGAGAARDPWGNAYYYTDLTGPGNGAARKDRQLNPLNSDFDLFSAGKNGEFRPQITHRTSLDDVIRARDGAFVDLAEKF